MRGLPLWYLLGVCVWAGCKGEAVRAAQPHMESFSKLRIRALDLLELRADVERKKLLVKATENPEEPIPDNLEPVIEQMKAQNIELSAQDVAQREALFWQMLDAAFSDDPNILQAEILFLEKDGTVSSFRYPRSAELPAGVKWFGLRQQRTFAGLASCVNDESSEPCVLVQLRPRDYAGSAGLTVAYRRP
jgi:hypothetical protein